MYIFLFDMLYFFSSLCAFTFLKKITT
jgi:hypothetical protein